MERKLFVLSLTVTLFISLNASVLTGNVITLAHSDMKDEIAKWTTSPIFINGESWRFDAYNINDHNYFKLREIAYALTDTKKQFEVEWDDSANAIHLTSSKEYTPIGEEITVIGAGNMLLRSNRAIPTKSTIYLDGVEINLTAYNIDGANYFKLRDLGMTFNFSVDWNSSTNTITINTDKGYNVD